MEHAREREVEVDVRARRGEGGALAGEVPRPRRVREQVPHVGVAPRHVVDLVEERVPERRLVELDEPSDRVAALVPRIVERRVVGQPDARVVRLEAGEPVGPVAPLDVGGVVVGLFRVDRRVADDVVGVALRQVVDERVAAVGVDPDADPRGAAEPVDPEAPVAPDHVLGVSIRHRDRPRPHQAVVEDVRVGVDDGDVVEGFALLCGVEDAALVPLGVAPGHVLQLEEPGQVAAGHLPLVLVGQLAVVDKRLCRARALERPLGPEQEPVRPDRLREVLQAVVDLEA